MLRINGSYDLATEGRPAEAADYALRNVAMLEEALRREPDDAGYRDRLYRTFSVAATAADHAAESSKSSVDTELRGRLADELEKLAAAALADERLPNEERAARADMRRQAAREARERSRPAPPVSNN